MSVESTGCRGTDRSTLDIGAAILVVDKEKEFPGEDSKQHRAERRAAVRPQNQVTPLLLVWPRPREAATLFRDIASWAGRVSTCSDN
jgi:hypothetical protein